MCIDFLVGFWVCDKAGKMRELKSGMPQLDPCCFPLLHPRGTLGFRWFMKKNGIRQELTDGEKRMQEELDEANQLEGEEMLDETVDPNPFPKEMDDGDDMMDEEENDLDQDEPTTSVNANVPLSEAMDDIDDDNMIDEEENHLDHDAPTSSVTENAPIVPLPKAMDTNPIDSDEDSLNDAEQQLDTDEIDVMAPNDNVLDPDAHTYDSSKCGSKSNISERQFYRYRLAMRANKKGTFHWLW